LTRLSLDIAEGPSVVYTISNTSRIKTENTHTGRRGLQCQIFDEDCTVMLISSLGFDSWLVIGEESY